MLINSPNISGSLKVTGNTVITGSLTVLGGINATIQGTAATASYVQYTSVANKPALVSGSSQISFTGITNKPTLVSGSGQISFNGITNKPALVSGSSQISYSGVSGKPSGIVSSSVQVRGYNIFATTGSNQFKNNQVITGSLTVTGQVVAQTLNVQQVTSSIVYSSGSNRFGNSLSNRQQFTGSVNVTGSMTVNGNVLLTTTDSLVATNTSDGSDNKSINISGGGTQSVGRGANLRLYGNEYSGEAGNAYIYTGNGANSNIVLNAYSSTSTIQLWTDNTERLRIISGGNVGIGTTTPAQKLQINGPLALSNLAEDFTTNQEYAYPIIYAGNLSGLGNGELVIQPRTTATRNIRFVTRSSGAVSGTNPDTRIIIRWEGNVGIGTTSPSTPLHLSANASSNWISTFTNTGTSGHTMYFGYNNGTTTTYGLYIEGGRGNADQLDFAVVNKFYVNGDGKVGIGISSPSSKLSVDGDIRLQSSTAAAKSLIFSSPASNWGPQDSSIKFTPADGVDAATTLSFNLWDGVGAINERMRITAGGNVGIGTTSPGNFNALTFTSPILDVIGSLNVRGIAANGASVINIGGETYRKAAIFTSIQDQDPFLGFSVGSGGGTSSSTTERMRITSGGYVGIGTTDPSNHKLYVQGNLSMSGSGLMRTYTAQSTTLGAKFDIFRFLNDAGSLIAQGAISGILFINASDTATGGNQISYTFHLQTNGNGTSQANLTQMSFQLRGTQPITSIGLENDGGGGGVKVVANVVGSGVSGCIVRATFVGVAI
jgi:hypothetical protein